MIVRIKLQLEPTVSAARDLSSKLALALSGMLTPTSVICFAVSLWRLLGDLNITGEFMFRGGLLSHWQVWLAFGILLQTLSVYLDRYGRRAERQS